MYKSNAANEITLDTQHWIFVCISLNIHNTKKCLIMLQMKSH